MIRFVDIREAETGYNFALWDTITDRWIQLYDDQAWDNWDDLLESVNLTALLSHKEKSELLSRIKSLCPAWVFEKKEEES